MVMKRIIVLALILSACGAEIPAAGPYSSPAESPSTSTTTVTPTSEAVPPTTVADEPTPPPTTETTMPSREPPERVDPDPEPKFTGEVPEDLLAPVLADAASRLGVAADQLTVVRAEAVVWSDGSLGCPQPGQSYIQVLVSGYWVEVSDGGKLLDYRLTESGGFFVCEGGPGAGTGSDS